LAHEGRFARPVRGKREWDENENETGSIAVGFPPRLALRSHQNITWVILASFEGET
jgi:hypothetical protein